MPINQEKSLAQLPITVRQLVIKRILPSIPKEEHQEFFSSTLPKILEHKPTNKTWNLLAYKFLPQIPANDRHNVLKHSLPKILNHDSTQNTFQIITNNILPKIPEKHRAYFTYATLPITLSYKPKSEDLIEFWNTVSTKIIPKLPEKNRPIYLNFSLKNFLERNNGNSFPKIKENFNIIANEIIPNVPVEHRDDFLNTLNSINEQNQNNSEYLKQYWNEIHTNILPNIPENKHKPIYNNILYSVTNPNINRKNMLDILTNTLDKIPERYQEQFIVNTLNRFSDNVNSKLVNLAIDKIAPILPHQYHSEFYRYGLSTLFSQPINEEKINLIANHILPVIPDEHKITILLDGLPYLSELDSNELKRQSEYAERILDKMNNSTFAFNIVYQNFGKLANPDASINRLNFSKTGSVLIPLGGKLAGNIIRVITRDSFQAWKKASDSGIPVEPIIRAYNAKYGKVRVYTKFAGTAFTDFILNNPKLSENVSAQRDRIISQLKQIGIEHGHPHDGNFVVDMINNKPVVRIIDFDMATIQKSYNQPYEPQR